MLFSKYTQLFLFMVVGVVGGSQMALGDSFKPCDVPLNRELLLLNMGSYNSPAPGVTVSLDRDSNSNIVGVDLSSLGWTLVRYIRNPLPISQGGVHYLAIFGTKLDGSADNITINFDDSCNVSGVELNDQFGAVDANSAVCKNIKNGVKDSDAVIAATGQFQYQHNQTEEELLCRKYYPEIMK